MPERSVHVQSGQFKEHVRLLRVLRGHLIELVDSFIHPAFPLQGQSEIVLRCRMRRWRLHFLLEACDGILVVVQSVVGQPQVKVDLGIFGSVRQDTVEVRYGFGEPRVRLLKNTKLLERFRIVGVGGQDLAVDILGRRVVLLLFKLLRFPQKVRGSLLGEGPRMKGKQGDDHE